MCAITDDKCASGPCGNGATCTSLPNAYRCTCTPQWTGARCQDDVNECAYHQLHSCIRGREKCTNTVGSYECACRDGLTGDTCETIVHDCSSRNPCLNGGQCRTVASGYVCDCRVGYIGRDCQHHDACASNPCRQGATCVQTIAGFRCMCQDGFTGRRCDEDVNECDDADACSTTAEPLCFNSVGSFACCAIGYAGADCRDVDECSDPQSCHGRGVCTNNDGGYTCDCEDGLDPGHFCAPACPNSANGAPPVAGVTAAMPADDRATVNTAGATVRPGEGATARPSAGVATGGPNSGATGGPNTDATVSSAVDSDDVNPTAAARGSDSTGDSTFNVLDYWYYIVAALGLLLLGLVIAVQRTKKGVTIQVSGTGDDDDVDDYFDASAYGVISSNLTARSSASAYSSDLSVDSAGSNSRKPLYYTDMSKYDTESSSYNIY